MKKFQIYTIVLLISISIGMSTQRIYGDGVGVYTSGGIASKVWDNRAVERSVEVPYGGGLVYDIEIPGADKYRLRFCLGYERVHAVTNSRGFNHAGLEYLESIGGEYYFFRNKSNYNRIYLQAIWGIALVRNENIRIWLGPELIIYYSNARFYYDGFVSIVYDPFGTPINQTGLSGTGSRNYDMVGTGTGLAFGLDIHLNSHYSLLIQGGVRIEGSIGTTDNESSSTSDLENRYGYEMGYSAYIRFGFLYRFDDTYLFGREENEANESHGNEEKIRFK